MSNSLRAAHGAGWRAGMSEPELVERSNGLKYLIPCVDLCPFKGRRQFLLRFFWIEGCHQGTAERLRRWLKSRRIA